VVPAAIVREAIIGALPWIAIFLDGAAGDAAAAAAYWRNYGCDRSGICERGGSVERSGVGRRHDRAERNSFGPAEAADKRVRRKAPRQQLLPERAQPGEE
jgi:hypothetical protein